ncbi:phosphoadenosine phosphosulfate reductase [Venturia nashicola]|uniref:phosphoadenylyl-sulfate reductase (thioredoxin) n=1 Tax=Venturia nashicola TaxID=86259 RepID=A0A4Z1NZN7_9PEZI|nr:phosphoadenosine phosphosulfate reductase [Venturia nashicola]TLD25970.1 phosphoadenosine phosphosulfate reductase [Venturia nashicola]
MSSSPISRTTSHDDIESGYASASSDSVAFTDVYFTKPHLKFLNRQLGQMDPEDILKWAMITLPNLYQTTAFGLTGLVTLDMLSKISNPTKIKIDLIFLDTLFHFQETLSLVDRVKRRYPDVNLHIYQPEGVSSAAQFNSKHGESLWEANDELYDWVAKVEPQQRAYADLQVKAVLTGRRRSQGGKRGDLDILEVDEAGVIKINPLANWTFKQVQEYVKQHDVPYNELLDRGYKSVGDWHSTQPIKEGEDERAGRWKGKAKTECGIHNKKSRYAQFLQEQENKFQQEELASALAAAQI